MGGSRKRRQRANRAKAKVGARRREASGVADPVVPDVYAEAVRAVLAKRPNARPKKVLRELRLRFCPDPDAEPANWPGNDRILRKAAFLKVAARKVARNSRK